MMAAQTWYVSPTGNDSFPGTSNQPFRQISKAVTNTHPGDTILVSDGTYLGFDVNSRSGSNGAPITIRAAGTNAVILPTTSALASRKAGAAICSRTAMPSAGKSNSAAGAY